MRSAMHIKRIAFWTLHLFVFSVAVAQSKNDKPVASPEPVTVSAFYSSNGPYGDLWNVYLAPDGAVTVTVRHMHSGETLSSYWPKPRRTAAIKTALESSRFFQLREGISPTNGVAIHGPELRLTATIGNRQRSVTLHEPSRVGDTDERARFFVVWDALFSELAFKPSLDVQR
jgi:hypothetical protein